MSLLDPACETVMISIAVTGKREVMKARCHFFGGLEIRPKARLIDVSGQNIDRFPVKN